MPSCLGRVTAFLIFFAGFCFLSARFDALVRVSLQEGETSEPIRENDGVLVVQLNSLIESPEIADYTSYKNQIKQRKSGRTSYLTAEAIKEYSDIVDERYKFF